MTVAPGEQKVQSLRIGGGAPCNDADVEVADAVGDVVGEVEDSQPSMGMPAAARFAYVRVRANKVDGVDNPVEESDAPAVNFGAILSVNINGRG